MDQRQALAGSGRKGGRFTAHTGQSAQLKAETILHEIPNRLWIACTSARARHFLQVPGLDPVDHSFSLGKQPASSCLTNRSRYRIDATISVRLAWNDDDCTKFTAERRLPAKSPHRQEWRRPPPARRPLPSCGHFQWQYQHSGCARLPVGRHLHQDLRHRLLAPET